VFCLKYAMFIICNHYVGVCSWNDIEKLDIFHFFWSRVRHKNSSEENNLRTEIDKLYCENVYVILLGYNQLLHSQSRIKLKVFFV